ncbi:MAG TPA: hypothetical protein HA343_06395 [Methanomassiliicoccales archaeon]|nr:hypothetical protein [Methanomassiliicoccales archaeon]
MADETYKGPCLWHAPDDRCANCKARRYRLDALGMKDTYGECRGQEDYRTCEFYKLKPVPKC